MLKYAIIMSHNKS